MKSLCTAARARLATLAGAAALTLSIASGAATPRAHASSRLADTINVNGAGSTFVNPLLTAWTKAYTKVDPSIRINYQAIGSGAGVSSFTAKTVDFAASDAFLTDAQIKALGGNELHLPLTIGPVAVLYNLPGVDATIKLDGPTLAQIFLGKITSWDDQAIAQLNPTVNLPGVPIVIAHRSDGSGTSFIFTHYLKAVSPAWSSKVGAGTAVAWPVGRGGKGTPGVAQIVKSTPGAIGYAELSYAVTTKLPTIQIKNKNGQFVAPSPQGAAADAAGAGTLPDDLRALIVDEPGANAYPIVGFSWAIISQTVSSADQAKKYTPLLKFLWWAVHQGQVGFPTAGPLRYASLSPTIVQADEQQIQSVTYNGNALYNG